MKEKTCLFIDQYSQIGGGQTIFVNLIRVALDAGFSVTAMFPTGGELEAKIRNEFGNRVQIAPVHEPRLNRGTKTFSDFVKIFFFTAYFMKFVPIIRRHKTIYVNGSRFFFPVFLVSTWVRRRFFYHVHLNHSPAEKRFISQIARSKRSYRVIANSRFVYEQFCKFDARLADNYKFVLVENSLSPAFSCLNFENRFHNMKRLSIAVFGRISHGKGQDVLLSLAAEFPDCSFFIIGQGYPKFENTLRQKASHLSNLSFAGNSINMAETVRNLSIHVSIVPSRVEEAFGLVAIESMACSCLTIVSNLGGLPDIAQRTSAFMYSSFEELTQLLKQLASLSEEELKKVALEQFTKTKEHFHFDTFQRSIKDVLTS